MGTSKGRSKGKARAKKAAAGGSRKDHRAIRESAIGRDLDDAQCRTLARAMDVRRLVDGELLIGEGEIDEALQVVVSGELAVTKHGYAGAEDQLHLLGRGELAGSMGFVDGLPRTASLHAVGPTVIYSLRRAALERLVDKEPELVYAVMRAVTRHAHAELRDLHFQIEELRNYILKQHGRY